MSLHDHRDTWALLEPVRIAAQICRACGGPSGPLGHIADASNMPVDKLPQRIMEISALKDRPVILVCRTDKRSTTAATLLRDAGFRDVGVLRGGMEQWNQKGLPVEARACMKRRTG